MIRRVREREKGGFGARCSGVPVQDLLAVVDQKRF